MGINDSRKFVEIPEDDYNSMSVDFSLLLSSFPTWSIDNSKCFLKYVGAKPSFLSSYTTIYYSEFLEIFYTDYSHPDEEEGPSNTEAEQAEIENQIAEAERLGSE